MMLVARHVLIDTGPLVAILDRRDQHHAICTETLRRVHAPLWTTWPVLTEVAWLLRNQPKGLQRLYASVTAGFIRIAELKEADLAELGEIQKKFPTLKPQMADLTLLLVAERERWDVVFTLDRRDFSVIQRKTRPKLKLIPEQLD